MKLNLYKRLFKSQVKDLRLDNDIEKKILKLSYIFELKLNSETIKYYEKNDIKGDDKIEI